MQRQPGRGCRQRQSQRSRAESAPSARRGNDTLTGGDGNDRFLFTDDGTAQTDTITDFTHGQDLIVLINHPSPVAATTFAYVASHATQTGADLSLAIDPTHTLLLRNATLAQLTASDFLFLA